MLRIPHHPYEALWIAEHTGARHRITIEPHTNDPIEVRDAVTYGRYLLRCACDDASAVTVTCLEPAVYARYARARDEGLTVPTFPEKTNLRWDLDPYTTARRLTADRARRIALDNHPWPTHVLTIQAFEHWCTRTMVKVDFLCTCGFRDGLTRETLSGRLTFEDCPLPAAPPLVSDLTTQTPPPVTKHIDLCALRASSITVPAEALQRARLALSTPTSERRPVYGRRAARR